MEGSRYALVVANDLYDDPGLRRLVAPAHDAAALAEALADPSIGGFDVRVLRNESAQEIRLAVEDFFADRAPEDLLLLHFSCHGLKNAAGELFLAVEDTRPTRLASTAVAADFVNRQMADSRAQRIALFLDCCYGGAFPRGMVVRAAGEAQVRDAFAGQDRVGGGRGRVVVTASSAMEYAFEGGQLATGTQTTPSVFTGAVVDGLTTGEADRDGDGWVGLTELVGYVTDRIHRITPNQNPQMWTFGSQGELLIARSRVRRVTPTPLAPELLEAMDSPLTATRFGVVDELRERLHDADLGQAYAAWQALQRMLGDDSRKVSEAARRGVEAAAPRTTPEALDLGTVGAEPAVGELRLDGPPIALAAVVSTDAAWLRVDQAGAVVRISAEPTDPGEHQGSVRVSGPTGDRAIPVRVRVSNPLAPPQQQPEQQPQARVQPQPEPEPQAEAEPPAEPEAPAQPEAEAEVQPEPEAVPPVARARATPWWAIGALIVGALVLVILNWPGSTESSKAWYDESGTGWYTYRSRTDPWILASVVALVAALAVRWSGRWARLVLGVVGGCMVFLLENGVVILGARIPYDSAAEWVATTTVAAALLGVLLVVLRLRVRPLWPVQPSGAALVLAGAALLVLSTTIKHDDGYSFLTVTKLGLLTPLLTVALAWPVLATSSRAATRLPVAVAVSTYSLIGMVSVVPAWTMDAAGSVLLTVLIGHTLVLAAMAMGIARPLHAAEAAPETVESPAPSTSRTTPVTSWWRQPWVAAVGVAVCALLLELINWAALQDGQRLWYNDDFGTPDLPRHWDDGSYLPAFLALVATAFSWRRGRFASYCLGVAAGAAMLYATAGLIALGGGLAYGNALYAWSISLVLAAVMLALIIAEAARRTPSPSYWHPDPATYAVLAVGFVFLVAIQLWPKDGGPSGVSYTSGLALLMPLVAASLVLLAVGSVAPAAAQIAFGAAATYLLLFVLAAIYPIGTDNVPAYFLGMIIGHLVLLAALVLGAIRRRGPKSANVGHLGL
ncbi:MAG TPA: caspase family protein [Kribbella sp.]|nr:caspase family protein [Kribbella sp.]